MKNTLKIILFFYCIISLNLSCFRKEEQLCVDLYTCVSPSSTIKIRSYLTGNTNSIIGIGDTIRMYARIPDSVFISKGPNRNQKITVQSLYHNYINKLKFEVSGGDTIFPGSEPNIGIKSGIFQLFNSYLIFEKFSNLTAMQPVPCWSEKTREIQFYTVLRKKGLYYLRTNTQLLVLVDNLGKKWFLNAEFEYFNKQTERRIDIHYNQFIKRIPATAQGTAWSYFNDTPGLYYFEVQ